MSILIKIHQKFTKHSHCRLIDVFAVHLSLIQIYKRNYLLIYLDFFTENNNRWKNTVFSTGLQEFYPS